MTTLAVTSSNSGLKLDPRTKFTLMIAVSVIMAGGSSADAEYILRVICGVLSRFVPGFMMGWYTARSTSVSEFATAMESMQA